MNIEQIENGIKVTIPKKENYTLDDLKQSLINKLKDKLNTNGGLCSCQSEINLLKVILDYEIEL